MQFQSRVLFIYFSPLTPVDPYTLVREPSTLSYPIGGGEAGKERQLLRQGRLIVKAISMPPLPPNPPPPSEKNLPSPFSPLTPCLSLFICQLTSLLGLSPNNC